MIRIDFTLVVTWLNFGILYFLMTRLFFRPLQAFLKERGEEIRSRREASERDAEERNDLDARYRKRLEQGRREVALHVEDEKQQLWIRRKHELDRRQKENFKRLEDLKARLSKQVEKGRKELDPRVGETAELVFRRVLGRGDGAKEAGT